MRVDLTAEEAAAVIALLDCQVVPDPREQSALGKIRAAVLAHGRVEPYRCPHNSTNLEHYMCTPCRENARLEP